MINLKTFAKTQYKKLEEIAPHQPWHRLLVFLTFCFAAFPFTMQLSEWTSNSTWIMGIPILSIYWGLQLRFLWLATKARELDWQELEDDLIGSIPVFQQNLAKAYAILRHEWRFILSSAFMLLALSQALTGFFLFHNCCPSSGDKGFLQYVGVARTGYYETPQSSVFSLEDRLFYGLIMVSTLLVLTLANSFLSVSLGLWAGRFGRALVWRLAIMGVALLLFWIFYSIREMPFYRCHRESYMFHNTCLLLPVRLLESFQSMSISFLDGGASMVTGLHSCGPREIFNFGGYQGRHLLVAICTVISQAILSAFFLRTANIEKRRMLKF